MPATSCLPRTRWATLGSRKLRGSSSPPSFSHAWLLCRASLRCSLAWLLSSSSSSSSSSESAKISSMLRTEKSEIRVFPGEPRAAEHDLGRLRVEGDWVPRTLPRVLPVTFALGRFFLLFLLFLLHGSLVQGTVPLGSGLGFPNVYQDSVVLLRQQPLYQLKPEGQRGAGEAHWPQRATQKEEDSAGALTATGDRLRSPSPAPSLQALEAPQLLPCQPHSVQPPHRPELADELGEQVPKLQAEVPPHVVGKLPDGFHLPGRAPRVQGRPPPCLPSHCADQAHRTIRPSEGVRVTATLFLAHPLDQLYFHNLSDTPPFP